MEQSTHTSIVFRVTVLPDDPKLTVEATRRRNVRSSKAWRRGRFTPRSVTKAHQHHLITDVSPG